MKIYAFMVRSWCFDYLFRFAYYVQKFKPLTEGQSIGTGYFWRTMHDLTIG